MHLPPAAEVCNMHSNSVCDNQLDLITMVAFEAMKETDDVLHRMILKFFGFMGSSGPIRNFSSKVFSVKVGQKNTLVVADSSLP